MDSKLFERVSETLTTLWNPLLSYLEYNSSSLSSCEKEEETLACFCFCFLFFKVAYILAEEEKLQALLVSFLFSTGGRDILVKEILQAGQHVGANISNITEHVIFVDFLVADIGQLSNVHQKEDIKKGSQVLSPRYQRGCGLTTYHVLINSSEVEN